MLRAAAQSMKRADGDAARHTARVIDCIGRRAARLLASGRYANHFAAMTVLRAPRPEITPEVLNARARGQLAGLVGVEVLDLGDSGLRSRLELRPDLLAANGYVHAATLVALADTTCGFGALAFLPDGARSYATLELASNFVGTVREGAVLCAAAPTELGRQTQSWEAVCVTADDGRRLAVFRCTQLVLY
jgi:uncharacterized protein (TIGR00369 family)